MYILAYIQYNYIMIHKEGTKKLIANWARRVNLPPDNLPRRSQFSLWATLRQFVPHIVFYFFVSFLFFLIIIRLRQIVIFDLINYTL